MLGVLAQRSPIKLTIAQWATLSQLKRTGGTWSTYLSKLKTAGLVEKSGELWTATPAGIAAAGAVPAAPTSTEELVAMWKGNLQGGAHIVAVRCFDASGNQANREISIKTRR